MWKIAVGFAGPGAGRIGAAVQRTEVTPRRAPRGDPGTARSVLAQRLNLPSTEMMDRSAKSSPVWSVVL